MPYWFALEINYVRHLHPSYTYWLLKSIWDQKKSGGELVEHRRS